MLRGYDLDQKSWPGLSLENPDKSYRRQSNGGNPHGLERGEGGRSLPSGIERSEGDQREGDQEAHRKDRAGTGLNSAEGERCPEQTQGQGKTRKGLGMS